MKKYIILINLYSVHTLQEYENFLISVQGLSLKYFSLGIENIDGKIAYTVLCREDDSEVVKRLIAICFVGSEFIELKVTNFKQKSFYFKLKNLDLFPIKRFDQFEEKVLKNSIDPIENLLEIIANEKGSKVVLNFKSFKQTTRSSISKGWNIIFFAKYFHLDKFFFKFFSLSFIRFFLLLWRNVFEAEVSKYHLSESSVDSAIDKFSKNLFWVSLEYSSGRNFTSFRRSVMAYMNKFSLPYANSFKPCKSEKFSLMSTEEVVSVLHFPLEDKFSNMHKVEYLKIANNFFCNSEGVSLATDGEPLTLSDEVRSKHMYVVGKTGMGKSTFLKSLISQDIKRGKGVFVVDPHGDLVEECLQTIPKARFNDLVYLDPADFNNPFVFNPLDVDSVYARNVLADNLVLVFKKIFGFSWGPRLEYFLKNALLLLVENKDVSLLSLPKVFLDENYLESLLQKSKNFFLVDFFRKEFLGVNMKTRMEIVAPILNKVGPLLMDPILRNIFGSVKTKVDLKYCIDTEKIVLVNLSKGKIGSINSNFLGSIIVSVLQTNILARSYLDAKDRKDCFMYIDEFQNFATDSFAEILSESRKYRLNLVLANQYFEQVSDELQAALVGNVANMVCFQLNYSDAEKAFLQYNEVIPLKCFLEIPRLNAYGQFSLENSKVYCSLNLRNYIDDNFENKNCTNILKSLSKKRYNSKTKLINWKLKKWVEV